MDGSRAENAAAGGVENAVEVEDRPDESRYVVSVDGTRAGFLDYRRHGDRFVAVHTEVDPAYGGQGLGGVLVRRVLDDVRAAGGRVVPVCPYVTHYLAKHPEYADLVEAPAAGPAAADPDVDRGTGS